jgi:hypothetical protein
MMGFSKQQRGIAVYGYPFFAYFLNGKMPE